MLYKHCFECGAENPPGCVICDECFHKGWNKLMQYENSGNDTEYVNHVQAWQDDRNFYNSEGDAYYDKPHISTKKAKTVHKSCTVRFFDQRHMNERIFTTNVERRLFRAIYGIS